MCRDWVINVEVRHRFKIRVKFCLWLDECNSQ